MKVSELSGAQLDFWVARAEKVDAQIIGRFCVFQTSNQHAIRVSESVTRKVKEKSGFLGREKERHEDIGYLYSPSQDWAQGGPIIEQEGVNLNRAEDGWVASLKRKHGNGHHVGDAEDPLVAAMRCYVASRFGDEVEE